MLKFHVCSVKLAYVFKVDKETLFYKVDIAKYGLVHECQP